MGGQDKTSKAQIEEEKRQFEKSYSEDVRRFELGEQLRQQQVGRSQEAFKGGEREFLSATEGPLPELEQFKQAILGRETEAQGMADKRTQLALKEAGVRGPEAALERSRQAGGMNISLQRMLSELSYNEAQGRRGKRADYFAGKAGAASRGIY